MPREDFATPEHGQERIDRGVLTFSRALRMLLSRNGLTHEQLSKLSQWCNPWGLTWISTSQISYLRTAATQKVGPKTIDALGQVNLRLAEAAGDRSPVVLALPPFGRIPSEFELPEQPYYLRHPESAEPLDAGGLYLIWIGRLMPADLEDGHISDMEARRLSANLSRIVQSWARDSRLTISEALERAMESYPVEEERRRAKLKAVAVGFEVYDGAQLGEELPALGELLGQLDGDGAIDPSDVRERLYRLPRS